MKYYQSLKFRRTKQKRRQITKISWTHKQTSTYNEEIPYLSGNRNNNQRIVSWYTRPEPMPERALP